MMDLTGFYKDKKVLITGHTGFKGSWMTYLLLEAGAKVTGYSLEPPTYPNLFEICSLAERLDRHVLGDIRDLDNLKKIFAYAAPEIVIGKVNVDENRELAARLEVTSLPHVFIYKDGKMVKDFATVMTKSKLLDLLANA